MIIPYNHKYNCNIKLNLTLYFNTIVYPYCYILLNRNPTLIIFIFNLNTTIIIIVYNSNRIKTDIDPTILFLTLFTLTSNRTTSTLHYYLNNHHIYIYLLKFNTIIISNNSYYLLLIRNLNSNNIYSKPNLLTIPLNSVLNLNIRNLNITTTSISTLPTSPSHAHSQQSCSTVLFLNSAMLVLLFDLWLCFMQYKDLIIHE
jgi:hypothetical protein